MTTGGRKKHRTSEKVRNFGRNTRALVRYNYAESQDFGGRRSNKKGELYRTTPLFSIG